jgi:drug/metabolite transporter (DMT)-like permease
VAAILLAALGGALFGALAVAQRWGLARAPDVEAAAVVSCVVGLAVALPITAVAGDADQLGRAEIWPYLLAGLLAPGAAQLLFVYAVRAIGAARSATLTAAAPLLAAVPAFLILDEPFRAALPVGAVLIVAGPVVLTGERSLPAGFRRVGILLALGSAALIAARDNFVRSHARSDAVSGLTAGTASLIAAAALLLAFLAVVRGRRAARALSRSLRPFVPSGVLLGLAYCTNLEALTRGRVTVVSPFYGTEALWALLLAYAFLGRAERIGARVLLAAGLMVTGAALIGAFR